MSHCIMYNDPADCSKPTCEGCELKGSNKIDPSRPCTDCHGAPEVHNSCDCAWADEVRAEIDAIRDKERWDDALQVTIKIMCHECPAAEECTFNVYDNNGGCSEFDRAFDILLNGDPSDACTICKAMGRKCIIEDDSYTDYYVFIVRRQYSFGTTGSEIEATVLIPQDLDNTTVAREIESFLEDRHSGMWAGPCVDPFKVSLKDNVEDCLVGRC